METNWKRNSRTNKTMDVVLMLGILGIILSFELAAILGGI